MGATKVTEAGQLRPPGRSPHATTRLVMAEEFVAGQELTAPSSATAGPALVRIAAPMATTITSTSISPTTPSISAPVGSPPELELAMRMVMLRAPACSAVAAGACGPHSARGRQLHLLEMNTAPGMTSHRWCRCRHGCRAFLRGAVHAIPQGGTPWLKASVPPIRFLRPRPQGRRAAGERAGSGPGIGPGVAQPDLRPAHPVRHHCPGYAW